MGSGGRVGGDELAVRRDLGDAGALLDATAKAAYRARLTELRAELEEAEGRNDPARAATARQEREFLVQELARAVGLGGRDRRAAAHAERARPGVCQACFANSQRCWDPNRSPPWPTRPEPTSARPPDSQHTTLATAAPAALGRR